MISCILRLLIYSGEFNTILFLYNALCHFNSHLSYAEENLIMDLKKKMGQFSCRYFVFTNEIALKCCHAFSTETLLFIYDSEANIVMAFALFTYVKYTVCPL